MVIRKLMAASVAALVISATAFTTEAQAQYRPYGPYYYRHYHHGWNNGGAVAAGVVGGLALGALAAGAAHPGYYGYGYGYPAYGYPEYGGCYVARQRVIDAWGYPHWRRVRVCD
jgi:hypothetical protein